MNAQEKNRKNQLINNWKTKMKKLYPEFTTSKWAKSSYRNNHPQLIK